MRVSGREGQRAVGMRIDLGYSLTHRASADIACFGVVWAASAEKYTGKHSDLGVLVNDLTRYFPVA